MPRKRKTIDEVKDDAEKALEAQKKHGIGEFKGFPFLLPEGLQFLKQRIEQVEESEKSESEQLTEVLQREIEVLMEMEDLLQQAENEFKGWSDTWQTIYANMLKASEVTHDFAVRFSKKGEFWQVGIYDSDGKPLSGRGVVFAEFPELEESGISKVEWAKIREMRESKEFKHGSTKIPKTTTEPEKSEFEQRLEGLKYLLKSGKFTESDYRQALEQLKREHNKK